MANMSYCRHENTYIDLKDVWDNWDEFNIADSNKSEIRARIKLIELVQLMAEELEFEDTELEIDNLKEALKNE